jgi:2-amino-4-hydroxy-6-hydroxymethyldihydropteridine diphosphokinase
MTTAYLALGSNRGDRLDNLRAACDQLEKHPLCALLVRSRIYETQSVEGGGEGDFLNAALRIQWQGSVGELWKVVSHIEEQMGRPMPPRHGPRLIDIDILMFGHEEIDSPELQIPHPRMMRRAFVLRPLCDVLEGGWCREYSNELN